ncbi:MAG: hypothetical protein MJ134_00325 [Lachnospiraceae bacterium]|nr:hypothetical protein [Lachnospiraceae bacterium]
MTDLNSSQKKIELSLQELLYYSFLIIMFTIKGFGLYDGQLFYKLFFVLAFLCLGGKLLLEEHSKIEWIFIVVLAILVIIMNRYSGEKGPLVIYAIIIGMKNMDLNKVMKLGACSLGISSLFFVLYKLCDLYNTPYILHKKIGMAQAIRWSLGYAHPNTTSVTYLAISMLCVYCLGKRYNWKYFLVFSLGNLWVNLYCLSYTGFLVCTLYLVLALTIKIDTMPRFLYFCAQLFYPVCVLFSIVIPYIIPTRIAEYLAENFWTTYSRTLLAKQYANWHTLSIWGINVSTLTDSKYTLDNSYLYSFIFNGLLFTVLISVLYVFAMNYLVKERNHAAIAIIVALCVEGIMEPLLFNTSFKNIGVFFLGWCFWEWMRHFTKNKQEKAILKNNDRVISFEYNAKIANSIVSAAIILMFFLVCIKNYPFAKINLPSDMHEILAAVNELEKAMILEQLRAIVTFAIMIVTGLWMIKNGYKKV